MRISFRIKLLASHAAVALAVGAVTLLVVERAVSDRMEAQVDRRLEAQAHAVSRWLERAGHPDRLAGRLAGVVGARVTFIDKLGVSVGESQTDADVQTPIAAEKLPGELRSAREGSVGRATRYSAPDREQVRYVAVPAADGSVVRLGLPIGEIDDTTAEIRRQLAAGAVASLVVALGLATFVAAALTRRLRAAQEIARRIGRGDYDVTVETDSTDEVGVLSRTLVKAASELEATEAKRREFLANVAHEIRTPVTSIRGYAETLESSDVDAETRREFVHTIHRNAVRIAKLVENLLELEAIQAGRAGPMDTESVAIAHIAENVTNTLQAQISDSSAVVKVEVPADLCATGDADAIERILLNLVDNALRHGGKAIQIVGRRQGQHAVVTVRDDGPGIPQEQRGRIFERFHRVDTAADRDRAGSGLGLAISRDLAQAMGGSLSLADTAEPGASFTLELPA